MTCELVIATILGPKQMFKPFSDLHTKFGMFYLVILRMSCDCNSKSSHWLYDHKPYGIVCTYNFVSFVSISIMTEASSSMNCIHTSLRLST